MFKKVYSLYSAFYPSLRFTLSLQSAFYTQSAFYPWSAVCVLHWPNLESEEKRTITPCFQMLGTPPSADRRRTWKTSNVVAWVASHADVLRGSSRVVTNPHERLRGRLWPGSVTAYIHETPPLVSPRNDERWHPAVSRIVGCFVSL